MPNVAGGVSSTPVFARPSPVELTDWPDKFTLTEELSLALWPPPIYTDKIGGVRCVGIAEADVVRLPVDFT